MKMTANFFRAKKNLCVVLWATLACGALAGCGDVRAPRVFSAHEVPEDVVNAPLTVARPSSASEMTKKWQRLGDVPSKPKNFDPLAVRQTMQELQDERAEGNQIRTRVDAE